jgi:hypothetical protein
MRRTAQASFSYYVRVDAETRDRARRLQDRLDCTARTLTERAFRELESKLSAEPPAARSRPHHRRRASEPASSALHPAT